MEKINEITAEFFKQVDAGANVSAVVLKKLKTSTTVWMECGRIALQKNDHKALDVLEQCLETKNFWNLLTENTYGDESLFFRTLNRCPKTNLRPHEKLGIQQVGCSLIDKNETSLFFAVFDHCDPPSPIIRQWTSASVYLNRSPISEFLIHRSRSSDCIIWLSESILSNLPSLDCLKNHMNASDVGRSCGMIAHVKEKRDTIVAVLNSKPESWEDFYAYDNDIARSWIENVYAEHQKNILQKHISHNNFSSRKSKI